MADLSRHECEHGMRRIFCEECNSTQEYQAGKKYDTQNGFKADIRYIYDGHLCGHVITDCTPCGFCMMHWTLDGFVMGADTGFDLIHQDDIKEHISNE